MRSLLFLLFLMIIVVNADLRVGFYNSTCPQAESIIQAVVRKRFLEGDTVTAALLRLHFHDCFVKGCDASILIDSTKNHTAEKDSPMSLGLSGFDIIDAAKTSLEARCPSSVSCADIIALATRDAVALAGGPKYQVPTGRRDALVSNSDDVNVPIPSFTVSQALKTFTDRNLTLEDMVVLLGAHTIGVAHCTFFESRLKAKDPTMEPRLLAKLTNLCNTTDSNRTVFLDQETWLRVDNEYYKQIMAHKGVLQIDQELALDSSSAPIVSSFASSNSLFRNKFGDALVKMGSLGVLVGGDGEIRMNCRAFN